MNIEKALHHAEKERDALEFKVKSGQVFYSKILSYYELVVEALKKQVPRKAVGVKRFADIDIGHCPTCNDGTNSEFNYCCSCGQKLTWRK